MQIKYVAASCVLALALPFSAAADPEDKAEYFIEALGLEGNKAEEVRQVLENHYSRGKDIKERAHDEMKQLKEQKKESLQAVLTEEEMNRAEAIGKLMKGKKRDKDD